MGKDQSDTARKLLESFMRFKRTPWKAASVDKLTPSEMMVIGATKEMMAASGVDSVRLSDLKEKLGISSPTLSEQVSGLEAQGYVERAVDKEDRRSVRLSLTGKAEDKLKAIREAFAEKFIGLAEWLGEADGEELARLMGRVHEYFESVSAESASGDRGEREGEGKV